MTKIYEGGKTLYERDGDKKTLIAGKSKTIDTFYENTVREAASVARYYTLNRTGLDDSFEGAVEVEQAILKHFGLE